MKEREKEKSKNRKIINIKEEMTCGRRTQNFMASPCHPLFGRVTILGMIIKKKKIVSCEQALLMN